ncbi:hypothetical protein R1sor_020530 [Riccia sorocarpa]|uniref:Uncharacterized protein n=1 Tax=Riccia sorocarpa TaxID=122646 RepID=A0ABD3IFJ4_9MARC
MGSKRRNTDSPPAIPGMYYDPERNRYYALRPDTPAWSSRLKTVAEQKWRDQEAAKIEREEWILRKGRIPKAVFAGVEKFEDGNTLFSLLRKREQSGHSWKMKTGTNSLDFQRQILEADIRSMNFRKEPQISSYASVPCDGGIEQCQLELQTVEGLIKTDAILAAGFNKLQIFQLRQPGDASVMRSGHSTSRGNIHPSPFTHGGSEIETRGADSCLKAPILRPIFSELALTSKITSMKKLNEWQEDDDTPENRLTGSVIFTTLGNGTEGGFVYLMRSRQDGFDEDSRPITSRARVRFNSDIHTAACNPRGKQASMGLSRGSAVLDLETNEITSVFNFRSSPQAQEFDNMGNVLLCGHRNGMILTYDLRCPPPVGGSTRHERREARLRKDYEQKMQMGSAVSSMSILRRNEHYLIASAVNGEMWQWDRRLPERGPVRTFEGHINSHYPLTFRLDPTERILAAGGADATLRLWSVKTARLLHVERYLGCIPNTVCWNYSYCTSKRGPWLCHEEPRFEDDSPWCLWTGSSRLLHFLGGHGT